MRRICQSILALCIFLRKFACIQVSSSRLYRLNFRILKNILFCQDLKVETCIRQIKEELEENDMADKKHAYLVSRLYCVCDEKYIIKTYIVEAFFLFLIALFVSLIFGVEVQKLRYLQQSDGKNPISSTTQIPIVTTTMVSTSSPPIDEDEIIVLSHLRSMKSQLIFDSKPRVTK